MRNVVTCALVVVALAVCVSTSWAESPVSEVTLYTHAELDPFIPGEPWEGTAILTLDEVEYDGTSVYVGSPKSKMNENNFHNFASATYDFGDLGSFEIWERAKTVFDIVETDPFYRHHTYTGINMITEGTGAFADARGVLHIDGYTEYVFRFDDIAGPRVAGVADYTSAGMIYGIDLPAGVATHSFAAVPEPSAWVLLLTGIAGMATYALRRQRRTA